jgi:hypothetical protein
MPLRSSVTASNELPSSNEKQMGQFPKSIAAPKASKPPELRNRRKIDFIWPSPRAVYGRGLDQA